ncbi:MAG: PilZ domain-containing protein [Acidobacteriota bacterium]
MAQPGSDPSARPSGNTITPLRLRFEQFSSFVTTYAPRISLQGVFLRTSRPKPPGSRLQVDFQLADGTSLIRAVGDVVWIRLEAMGPDQPTGMALRFDAVNDEGRMLILKIFEEHLAKGGFPFELEPMPAGATDDPHALDDDPPAAAAAPMLPFDEAPALELDAPPADDPLLGDDLLADGNPLPDIDTLADVDALADDDPFSGALPDLSDAALPDIDFGIAPDPAAAADAEAPRDFFGRAEDADDESPDAGAGTDDAFALDEPLPDFELTEPIHANSAAEDDFDGLDFDMSRPNLTRDAEPTADAPADASDTSDSLFDDPLVAPTFTDDAPPPSAAGVFDAGAPAADNPFGLDEAASWPPESADAAAEEAPSAPGSAAWPPADLDDAPPAEAPSDLDDAPLAEAPSDLDASLLGSVDPDLLGESTEETAPSAPLGFDRGQDDADALPAFGGHADESLADVDLDAPPKRRSRLPLIAAVLVLALAGAGYFFRDMILPSAGSDDAVGAIATADPAAAPGPPAGAGSEPPNAAAPADAAGAATDGDGTRSVPAQPPQPNTAAPQPAATAPAPAPSAADSNRRAAAQRPAANRPRADANRGGGGGPAATAFRDVSWTTAGARTVITLEANGALASSRVEQVRVGSDSPRELLRIDGIDVVLPARDIGSGAVQRIRSGLHPQPDGSSRLHIVIDLTSHAVELESLENLGDRITLTFRTP